MIRVLKGYARKSVIMCELFEAIRSDNKIIIDCVGVQSLFLTGNVYCPNEETLREILQTVKDNDWKHVFLYTHLSEDKLYETLETLEDFKEAFDTILITIQTDRSYEGRFEILEYK